MPRPDCPSMLPLLSIHATIPSERLPKMHFFTAVTLLATLAWAMALLLLVQGQERFGESQPSIWICKQERTAS